MTTHTLAFVDTETTALGPLARPWEVAIIRRQPDGTETEILRTVRYTPTTLPPGTNPDALDIGGWHARGWGEGLQRYWTSLGAYDDDPVVQVGEGPEWAIAGSVHRQLAGTVLIGVGVHFDAAVLSAMFQRHGLDPEPWHYALLDLKAATWGALSDRARIVPLPLRSEDLAAELEVQPPGDQERHTALGDARWARRWFDAIRCDDTAASGGAQA